MSVMSKKTAPTKAEPVKDPESLTLKKDIGDRRTKAEFMVDALLECGNVPNASLIKLFHLNCAELDLDACVKTLKATAKRVDDGDNSDLEGMLSAQAMALNSVFVNLATRANNANLMPHMETYMRLALKAQNQCRATIDTLAQIRNPRQTVITKQANITNGPQQVNNTLNQISEQERKISKNSETEQNKLFAHEEELPYMDTRTESQTSGDNPAMAALGKVNRADNRGRKSKGCA
jgi:hypothetical protein